MTSSRNGLEQALVGARFLGAELDTKFRVLALTFEPDPPQYVWATPAPEDRRVQVLCHPVSTILGALHRHADRQLLSFTEEQLPQVTAALDGARVGPRLFGLAEPRPGSWGPRFSLEGRSTAPNGTANTVTVQTEADDLSFSLFARFDEVEVKDPTGVTLELP